MNSTRISDDDTFDTFIRARYVMLTGVHPFDLCGNATNEEIERQILLRKMPPLWNSSMTSHLSDDAIALIEQLLQWDSSKRLTAHQVLENPWVRGETASSDKMADSDKRLSKYRLYKSKLGARVFASMVLLAPRADGKKTAHDQSSDSRTSLIEHAFRRLDHGRKGYVTTADIQQLTQQQPQTEIAEKSNDEEPMSLSSFADLMSETMKNQYVSFTRARLLASSLSLRGVHLILIGWHSVSKRTRHISRRRRWRVHVSRFVSCRTVGIVGKKLNIWWAGTLCVTGTFSTLE
jgi:serine/threonine protein kinase